jgi:TolB protein
VTSFRIGSLTLALGLTLACGRAPEPVPQTTSDHAVPRRVEADPREVHLGDLTMLTDGGENAEAYFSFDGRKLIFQARFGPWPCDQIFTMDATGSPPQLVSTGKGRTTCSYFFPGGHHILYSSTHLASPDCPPTPDMSRGYVWPVYADYEIVRAAADGSDVVNLSDSPGYDAEATISPKGDRVVFTSTRDGDLDIYTMNLDGSDVRRLTDQLGYDGGPFFSPDGTKIVYRANHPTDPTEIADYTSLLAEGLIRPGRLEIWVMDADGGNKRQVTSLGAASFAPFFHPSGEKIVFSSNHGQENPREFDLWMVDLDGSHLERITWAEGFDGFPMWAPDGRQFVFCSNRNDAKPGETNVFVARWKD